MKTPRWEVSPGATVALLATRQFVWCDLYTFELTGTLNDGVPLRYSTGDTDVTDGTNVWVHGAPAFDQDQQHGTKAVAHWKVGLDVDTWQVTVQPRNSDLNGTAYPDKIGTVPWLAAAQAGVFDGAVAYVERAFFAAWPPFPRIPALTPTGIVNIFTGRVAEIDVGRTAATISINSHLELLGITMPRNLYQAPCGHVLFDVGCTLSRNSYAVEATIQEGSAGEILYVTPVSAPGSGTFALGSLTVTSGVNAGFSRTIRSMLAGSYLGNTQIYMIAPLPSPPAIGDQVTLYPGCDKTTTTCNLFGNIANFGGQPYIPAPETAV
jgi:hypothetical protein